MSEAALMRQAVAAFAAAMLRDDDDTTGATTAMMAVIKARGGVHVVDGEEMVDRAVYAAVTTEVIDRFIASLAAKLGPRLDAHSPEVGEAADRELADMRADLAAMLAR